VITGLALQSLGVQRGEQVLFQGLDLALGVGEAAALTGPNGAGKTSLLRTVAGFIRPFAGEVRFAGAAGEVDADEARRTDCHFIGWQDGMKPGRTAREELLFQALWTGSDADGALAAARGLGVEAALDLEVRQLSAGQRRRLALARLCASRRALWLLDEPVAPLDARSRALFAGIMAAHLSGGGLILAAVHDPLPMAARQVELGG